MGLFKNLINKLSKKSNKELQNLSKQAQAWYRQAAVITKDFEKTPQQFVNGISQDRVTKILPGNLYLYGYDAKWKDILPFYDRYPLVFPFRKLPDGFIGLNLHYLPLHLRIELFDGLMEFKNNKNMNETTQLKFSWALITGLSKYKLAEPCVHRYLNSHLRSPLRLIKPEDWEKAMLLPVEKFTGASKQEVWRMVK